MKENYSLFIAVAILLTYFNSAAQCPPQALPAKVSGIPQYFICPGESVTLTASGLNIYNWSNGVIDPHKYKRPRPERF